ncbi:MTTP isoform 11 [Pongo abelii]|uniref:MTTP isoform 11 n=1 Tax=Pongo abelii TaxID=9601 RepID=A0A2J8TQL6_PONAB|nr:MTTP isoform 11 [Pongo abelii]
MEERGGVYAGRGLELGFWEWEVVTVMSVFSRSRIKCVPADVYSFIYSCRPSIITRIHKTEEGDRRDGQSDMK